MKALCAARDRGIALLMVMIVITVLAIIAGGFAYSMRVEMRLARNASYDSDLEWLGRSGVELGRFVLGQSMNIPGEMYDALNQKWAGGPMGTNEAMADVHLEDNELGPGKFSVKIIDLERTVNINYADEQVLRQALNMMGADASEAPAIVDSIIDWRDADDDEKLNGAETRYYMSLKPPYIAKNGPMEDLSELLYVKGMNPVLYWGPNHSNAMAYANPNRKPSHMERPTANVGFVDLFNTFSGPTLNINTASAVALQLIPGLDDNTANEIIHMRSGYDGVEGTEDDAPFRSPGELVNIPGMSPIGVQGLSRYTTVRSRTFEIRVEAEINGVKRTYLAVVQRRSPRDLPILAFHWK